MPVLSLVPAGFAIPTGILLREACSTVCASQLGGFPVIRTFNETLAEWNDLALGIIRASQQAWAMYSATIWLETHLQWLR